MLDDLPIGTLIALSSIVLAIIGYLSGDLSITDAFLAVGAVNGGAGVLGIARAQSGKGIRSK